MAQLLSHRSKVEICTFLEYDECIRLPSTEWRLIAKHCVLQGNEDDPADIPSDEYFSSDGFRIAVGERSLSEALKLVFSPGEDLLLWQAVPNGFIEAVVEVSLLWACYASFPLSRPDCDRCESEYFWTIRLFWVVFVQKFPDFSAFLGHVKGPNNLSTPSCR